MRLMPYVSFSQSGQEVHWSFCRFHGLVSGHDILPCRGLTGTNIAGSNPCLHNQPRDDSLATW
ncbi:hypothetical protein DPMN_167460 [Dreissena polymorpha]|uniref:Uncharacterized protein n=1 Tax=Dreissena polymorpha TaxID=45954 RepID=A0A9D4F3X9_DREPO|nr:hypothetical protein DPMN_167460 [Dreissena polymorpha]